MLRSNVVEVALLEPGRFRCSGPVLRGTPQGVEAIALAKLPDVARLSLGALALARSPRITRTAWLDLATRCGLRDERNRQYTGPPFLALIETLLDVGAVQELGNDYVLDPRWLVPVLDRMHAEGKLQPAVHALGIRYGGRVNEEPSLGFLGDVRVGAAMGNSARVERAFGWMYGVYDPRDIELHRAFGDHPSAAWLQHVPQGILPGYLIRVLDSAVDNLHEPGAAVLDAAAASDDLAVRVRLAGYRALRGETTAAEHALAPTLAAPRPERLAREAASVVALCTGDVERARAQCTLSAKGKPERGPRWMTCLAMLVELTTDGTDLEKLAERIDTLRRRDLMDVAMDALASLVDARRGRPHHARQLEAARTWIDILILATQLRWLAPKRAIGPVDRVAQLARDGGFEWLAQQLETMSASAPATLRSLWQHKEPWELTLAALAALTPGTTANVAADKPQGELHWFVDSHAYHLDLTARWVTPSARRGKEISVARLVSGAGLVLRPEDHAIVARLSTAKTLREALPRSALALLAGHPHVHDATGEPVLVRSARPTLSMRHEGAHTSVQLDPPALMTERLTIEAAPGTLTITLHDDASQQIARVLGGAPLRVPKAGLDSLLRTLGGLAERIDVQATGLTTPEEPADPTLHAQLRRTPHGLSAALRVVPAAGAAARVPGVGPAAIVQDAHNGLRSFRRDLAAETAALAALLAACPMTADLTDAEAVAHAPDLASALEVLGELGAFTAEGAVPRLVLTWREGTPLHVTSTAVSKVRVTIAGDTSWLELRGELRADDGSVVKMKELLAGMAASSGRFVPLGNERYLALTADLQQRLAALAHVQQLGTKKGLSSALLPALESVTGGLDVEWGKVLQKRRQAMQRAAEVRPRVPRLLQAELRDYQREGFELLSRQCTAGIGVVLADDMGLGKTVQAIAVLLERRASGPALVVAPTTVLRNWESELGRFAPSLRVVRFAEGDRAGLVHAARAGDVLLASYGILPTAPELADRTWATLVFDEAHGLKNAATQRWKAASALSADARVALTGTPVENHIGELHALFDVVAPGVLGSRAAFQRVFAAPIGRGDRSASSTLRQIVRPLVLRRTKAQVLTELPPKTELLQLVTASAEHRAFYEALRQTALEKVQRAGKAGAKATRDRISVLAEITRLRRAAIDPRLVGGASAPSGSKIDRLAQVLEDLRAEGHRALVFSQFLEVLDLARARLEPLGFGCLRLDGTMNASARAAVVDAFQAGEGDVLLASLKAGGVGVNLTAADYVIHLDPWWNPAVEDQATDRAHRMGQQRPVTVLRLVTEGTLEEKVLSLHADKRRLFEETVGDADGTGVLDVEKLIELLG